MFARRLSLGLRLPHIELDALYWSAGWIPRPEPVFRRLIGEVADAPRWVADGNYGSVRELLWPRATAVMWLNYGFATVFARTLARSVRRIFSREEVFSGNRESVWLTFFTRESILVWTATTFHRRRRTYAEIRAQGLYPGLAWHEFRRPSAAESFLREYEIA